MYTAPIALYIIIFKWLLDVALHSALLIKCQFSLTTYGDYTEASRMNSAQGDYWKSNCVDIDQIKLLQTTLNSVITATQESSSDAACLYIRQSELK